LYLASLTQRSACGFTLSLYADAAFGGSIHQKMSASIYEQTESVKG
jgi:hypothetical protein